MISIAPSAYTSDELTCSIIDLEAERDSDNARASTVANEAAVLAEFDLFAEARRIYVRARRDQLVRSSAII